MAVKEWKKLDRLRSTPAILSENC